MRHPDRQDQRRSVPDTRRWSCHPPQKTAVRPLIGYIRRVAATTDRDVEHLRRSLVNYAIQEGFVLLRVLADRCQAHTIAFAELISMLTWGDAAHIVVPTMQHLAQFPSVQQAMKDLLESQAGARVLVVNLGSEEPR